MANSNPKAGGTLDLSTGKPAPPPQPAPAPPPMPEDADPTVKAGRTLDLSKTEGGRSRKRAVDAFGSGIAVRETLDLSTKTVEAPEESKAPAEANTQLPREAGGRRPSKGSHRPKGGGKRERGKAPAASSESLGDLLSPEVLAKLRGG